MKTAFVFLTALMLASFSIKTYAQTSAPTTISGAVLDGDKAPLTAATINLINAGDSAIIKATVSDNEGRFQFRDIKNGSYLVSYSAVGHRKAYSSAFRVDGSNVTLQTIQLENESKNLKAVTVVSRKLMVEQKIDRTVLNVDAAVTNTGANALEVLEKAPGVQVDKDGNISLKGKQGVVVMIDGRPAYLSGAELANMLKGMEASQLDQIEIMTNPPAKYDAAGNSGVINIKTKKNKMRGFNGNLTVGIGQGSYFKTNESLNLNYRNSKVNLFANYSFGKNRYFQELDIFRRYKNEDGSTRAIFEQSSLMRRNRTNNNLKLGMDYYLTKKTTLGFTISGFYNPEEQDGSNTSYLQNPSKITDSIVYAKSDIKELWKNGSINLNVRHQYDSTGRELTADVDYIRYDASNEQEFTNTTYTDNWIKKYDEVLRGDLPVVIDIYSARVDYTHPLKNEAKFEVGLKTSYVQTDNRANYFELIDGAFQPDYKKINYFDYKENVNAAYINFNKQITKKLGVQAGLRYENTNYKGFQYGNPTKQDSSFSRSYDSWFPTIYFSYKASDAHQFTVSFGRRIDRPAYQDLNPFLFFIDKYTYGQGNPYLKPQYSNNYEASHIFKGIITTTINYGSTSNLFVETFDQPDSQNGYNYATIVRQGNIGKMENAGISVNAQLQPAKWFSSNVYANYNYSKYDGMINGELVKVEAGNMVVSVNNQFKFTKGWSAELSGWYRSKGVEGQLSIDPMGALSAGIAKQVLKGKGSIKLNMRDIFYTQIAHGDINFKSTEASFENRRDTRVANLTFTYRFGKPMNGNGQRKKSSATEEQNRVKTGN